MSTALILSILDGITKLAIAALEGQTPDQRKVLWDRYIQITQPLHDLIVKLEGVGAKP